MPTTRSNKSTALPEPVPDTAVTTTPEDSSGSTATTTWTHGTTTTATEAPRAPGQQNPARAASVRAGSTARSYSRRKKELEARAELARLELQAAQAAAAQARAQLELLKLDDDNESIVEEPIIDKEDDVSKWVQATVKPPEKGQLDMAMPPPDATTPKDTSRSDTRNLADAIVKAISTATRHGTAAPSFLHDLPPFDGSCSEWIAFKTVYEDTAPLFTSTQNMARLRKAIKGTAREAVKSSLYSDCQPEDVLEALRRRFGRPDALVLAELEKIKNLPKLNETARDMCIFASQVNNTVTAIRGLKKPQYLHSPEMLKHIVDKMPSVIKYRWYDFAAEKESEEPDLMMMMKFLNREADRCGPYAVQEVTRKQAPARHVAHTTTETTERQQPRTSCSHCGEDHLMLNCKGFLQASTKERWDSAKKSRLCFKCLQGRHRKETCKKPPCKICRRWHHPLLHEDKEQDKQEEKEVANNVRLPVNVLKTARAYLKMAPVEVYGPKGSKRILALLDEGSTVTLLDSSVAEEIGLQGPKVGLTLETVGGRQVTEEGSMKLDLQIRGVHQSKKRKVKGARTIGNINLTPQRINKERLEECAHLRKITEQLFYEEEPPKLLIGQDNWELIVSKSTRKGTRSQPVASFTLLGWVLHGFDAGNTKPVRFVTCAHISAQEDKLEKLIKEHFAVESLGIQPRRPTMDADGKALEILEETSRRLPNGRFEVGLLWKSSGERMPNNFKSAENRLKSIERKLDRDDGLKKEYEQQIKNLLDQGYAEEVGPESKSDRKWYLPHFTVTHPTKRKRRLVFDAAAKYEGKSLNDALLPGPDLLQSLFGVLLRFRQWPIAVVADIKEMFLQIKIRKEDRDSLRFLWRHEKRTGPPRQYRMTSLIFGAACSPSAAIFVKNKNAAEHRHTYPEAACAVERNHYMDDYLQSFKTEQEAIKTASEVDTIHRSAGLHLRGWASNQRKVLAELGAHETAADAVELGSKEEKTLGLRWFTENDEIGFRTCLRNVGQDVISRDKTPTKREVTSAVMSTFDPLGLAAPVLIQGKRLIQDIWRSGVGWDEKIKPDNEKTWKAYLTSLQLLKDLRLPRCVAYTGHEGELHIFTDASETAYACAAYWRHRHGHSTYTVTLLGGKARVTPLKPVSVPRLELQAALLGTRLAQAIKEELDMKIANTTYWTDSSTVLAWIKADPRTFKPFVAHRLAEIEDTTKPHQWRWVPTRQNPADDATRGVPHDFGGSHRWFTGPAFLREEEDSWPRARSFKAAPTGEEKETHLAAVVNEAKEFSTPAPERFSSWIRLLRTTARMLQFINACRKKQPVNLNRKIESQDPTWRRNRRTRDTKGAIPTAQSERKLLPLGPELLEEAEKLLLRRSQRDSFGRDVDLIKKGKPLDKGSNLKKLAVTLDDGLLRMHGRIDAVKGMEETYKRPVILHSKHSVAQLLIRHYHEHLNHGNHATVLNELRQRYWIIGLRSAVRRAAHHCQWCKVYRGTPQRPPTGDLPKERLRHGEPPFTHAAVDYFGPMTVTIGRRHEKRWGALFTCLTTRAVHVELAASLSTDSMILALRRMAARRGMPRTIFSDNGTNFVGANKELKEAAEELNIDALAAEADKMGVQWKFIPPGAPNMGGAWERLVRSVKTALAVTLKGRHPQEEVLHTLVTEAEHIVNSRPLINAEENTSEEALTPNHFLIGRSCGARRIGTFTDGDLTGKRTWKIAQRLSDHFWSRWVKEYLPTLLPRKIDGRTSGQDLRRGDTVLIMDSTLPRCVWPRGQITTVHQGPDGRTRIIEVRTTSSVLRRPASKAVLLVPAASPGQEDGAVHEGEDVSDATTQIQRTKHT